MSQMPQKSCRTFHREDSAPLSIAETMEQGKTMLTPAELAVLLAISVKTVYSWTAAGTLPAVTLGASIRFCPVTTAKWLRDRSA